MPVIALAFAALVGLGSIAAHHEVGEGQRLGAFYVGDRVFDCRERK